jgi:predicted CopG family antitoxin
MTTDTITISREEYKRLKSLEKVEWEIVGEFKNSLEDLKEGRFKEC